MDPASSAGRQTGATLKTRLTDYYISDIMKSSSKENITSISTTRNQKPETRNGKNEVFPRTPYAFLTEPEFSPNGIVEQVATIFLTNKECPFQCLMCDLWKNTLDESVKPGDIPAQIDYALERLPEATQVKLYNSGNFFDHKAIPPADYLPIAQRMAGFNRLIVENHPKLCTNEVVWFKDLLECDFEIAMGLETIHPEVLPKLNKGMTLDDFERATAFLLEYGIDVRAFILLKPPFLNHEEAGVEWALKSIEWAFNSGVQCCSVIPTRPGIPEMDQLEAEGQFSRPTIESMETVLAEGLKMNKGRVFMDLWDVEQFYQGDPRGPARRERIETMNQSQKV